MTRVGTGGLLYLLVCAASSCHATPPSGIFSCSTDDECPDAQRCEEGLCQGKHGRASIAGPERSADAPDAGLPRDRTAANASDTAGADSEMHEVSAGASGSDRPREAAPQAGAPSSEPHEPKSQAGAPAAMPAAMTQPKAQLGAACTAGESCASGHCTDRVCCANQYCAECEACGPGGLCERVEPGTRDDSCATTLPVCNAQGRCSAPEGGVCSLTGVCFSGADSCQDGVCCKEQCGAFPLSQPLRITTGQKLSVVVQATTSCGITIRGHEGIYPAGQVSWSSDGQTFWPTTGTLSFMALVRR